MLERVVGRHHRRLLNVVLDLSCALRGMKWYARQDGLSCRPVHAGDRNRGGYLDKVARLVPDVYGLLHLLNVLHLLQLLYLVCEMVHVLEHVRGGTVRVVHVNGLLAELCRVHGGQHTPSGICLSGRMHRCRIGMMHSSTNILFRFKIHVDVPIWTKQVVRYVKVNIEIIIIVKKLPQLVRTQSILGT